MLKWSYRNIVAKYIINTKRPSFLCYNKMNEYVNQGERYGETDSEDYHCLFAPILHHSLCWREGLERKMACLLEAWCYRIDTGTAWKWCQWEFWTHERDTPGVHQEQYTLCRDQKLRRPRQTHPHDGSEWHSIFWQYPSRRLDHRSQSRCRQSIQCTICQSLLSSSCILLFSQAWQSSQKWALWSTRESTGALIFWWGAAKISLWEKNGTYQ